VLERKIARLDDEKIVVNQKLLTVTESAEATRLQSRMSDLTAHLAEFEEEWLQRSAELELDEVRERESYPGGFDSRPI
jgi:hypothetical protein